jgi:hypothetical protein
VSIKKHIRESLQDGGLHFNSRKPRDEKYDINSTISSAKGTVKAFNFPPHGNFLNFFTRFIAPPGEFSHKNE